MSSKAKELINELWGLWEDFAEAGEITIGKGFSDNYNRLKKQVYQYAQEQQGEGWISVEDRLPKNRTSRLVYTSYKRTFVGYFDDVIGWRHVNNHRGITSVTHWQPLPKPPSK